ncbi:MAG: hypothetical protein GW859_03565 [Sphingomonadales bacterium]|nr:hypothetical protein [Sphingomonadales bacterium]
MLTLHGLRIAISDGNEPRQPQADIVWQTHRVASLPAEPEAGDPIAIVRNERTASGVATDHIFGYNDRVRCRFRVDADGSAVTTWALPEVSDRDLFSLFAEPVMRTVLVNRQLLSFHAAALAKDGRAILIMAAKGAGKSTLSWALQRQGWQLLADDLVHTQVLDGQWSAHAGHRDTKLTPGAARALGYGTKTLRPRFDDVGPASSAFLFDKLVIDPTGGAPPTAAVPLSDILFLSHRDTTLDAPSIQRLGPVAGTRCLVEHATPDSVAPNAPPGVKFRRDLGSIAAAIPLAMLTLPDRLDLLAASAAMLDATLDDAPRPLATLTGP